MRVGAVPVGCYPSTNLSVIERKRAEVLGQQDDRVTLASSEQNARVGIIRLRKAERRGSNCIAWGTN